MGSALYTVIETAEFSRFAARYLTEESVTSLVDLLASRPEAGVLIRGTGGARKIRVPRPGFGKRGGARVIYYYHTGRAVYLFTGYVKAKRDDLTAEQKKVLKAVIKEIGDG